MSGPSGFIPTSSGTGSASSLVERTPGIGEEEPEEDLALQLLFRGPAPNIAVAWTDAEIQAGSRAAAELVPAQNATCLHDFAKSLMSQPDGALGIVFITVEVRNSLKHSIVWQVAEFTEATQKFVGHRVSRHNDSLAFPRQAIFSLSTVEVLVSPTLPFLSLIMGSIALTTAAAVAKFPIPDKILVPSGARLNMLTHSLEVELRQHDGVFHSRLFVLLPREEGPSATAVAGDSTEASRRVVKAVPPGTHHWYLCDECMLVGSRTEEHVYSSMIFGGARTVPGSAIQLGIGLLLRMAPKEARNFLSLRITSSISFDSVTDMELLAIRYGTDKADSSRFQLGECARLGYRRVCNCQELLFRLFHLKPHVMAVWSAFATEILDLIEHGSVRFPGIASNGVVNRYVELVLQTFFAQLHSPGLSASGSDAALLLLKMDVSNDVFGRMQLDAELLNRGGGGVYKRAAQDVPAQAGIGVDSTTASVAKKPRGGEKGPAFCFLSFSVEGCKRGTSCKFSHKKPTSEAERAVIKAGVQQRNGTLRGDAF